MRNSGALRAAQREKRGIGRVDGWQMRASAWTAGSFDEAIAIGAPLS